MRFTHLLLLGVLCLATFTGAASAQSIAVLTGSQGTSTSIPLFLGNPLGPATTAVGVPAGAFQLLAVPNGSKFYLLTNSTGITVLDRNFTNPRQILTSLNASPTRAALSPDGSKLFVIAGSIAYLINTSTDTIISGALSITGTPVDVAFSQDSLTAFILSNKDFTAYVTPVDMSTNTVGNNINLPVNGTATGIATGPNGLLYVSAPNGVFEINPRNLSITPGLNPNVAATIPVNGTPGRLQFTSDGSTAVALNRTPASGPAILFNLANKTAILANSSNLNGSLDQLVVAGDARIFVHTVQNGLFELSQGGGFSQGAITTGLPAGAQIVSVLPSNEVQAKTLYVIANSGGTNALYSVSLGTNALISQIAIPNDIAPALASASVNPTSGANSIQGIGTNQTISSGAVSQPLVARVLDANGQPVYNATVTFSVLSGGLTLTSGGATSTLTSTTANTNSNGFAQVYATAGVSAGTFQVQASVAGASTIGTFTINVTGGGVVPPGCTQNCNASGLFVVSGNGQLTSEQQVAPQLLLTIVRDANGNPVPGQQVTFSVTQGTGTVACTGVGDSFPYIPTGSCTGTVSSTTGLTTSLTVVTDNTGQAGVKYLGSTTFGQSFAQTVVNASSNVGSVNFTITTILVARPNGTQAAPPAAFITAPLPGTVPGFTGIRVVTGSAGQTVAGAIQVQVVAVDGPQQGTPIPGVALNVSGVDDPKTTPSGTCAGGIPLTDSTGTATCDLVLGPVVGTGALKVNVGGAISTPLVEVIVSQGAPSNINLTAGNGQSGLPGTQFTLRAQITDANGNVTPNVPVTFAVTSGSGTISAASTQSDTQGNVQATLTLGTTPGSVVVRITAGSGSTAANKSFTLNVNAPVNIGAVTAISGAGQNVVVGQTFGQPLVVQVTNTSGAAAPNVTVTFAVTGGSATLGAASAVTDAQGNASTTVIAGGSPGPITVTASVGTQTAQFALTSRLPGPAVTATSFRNGAGGSNGLAPCAIAVATAAGLAPGLSGTTVANAFGVGPLPLSLAGVSLTVNGIPAPIFWVSNTTAGGEAVAFQTPCEVTPGPASVVVTVSGGSTTVANVPVTKYQPGIFESVINGRRVAVLEHVSDGSFVTPDNPARRGEQLKMFVTGLGLGTPSTGTNRAGLGGQASDAQITVGVNNGGVRVIGSELLPGAIGIFTITFEVPSDTATGPQQNLGLIVTDPSDPAHTQIYAPGSFLPIS